MGETWLLVLLIVNVVIALLIIDFGWRRWWVPVLGLPIGIAPMISNILAFNIASWRGCFIHEWTAYPCLIGSTDISSILSLMVIASLLIGITWGLALGSIVLFAAMVVRWGRARLARESDEPPS